MKKIVASFIVAAVFTIPMAALVGRNPLFQHWMMSGHGWNAFDPLLNLFGAVGVEDEGNIVVNALLCASFVLVFVLTWFAVGAMTRRKQHKVS